MTTCTRGKASSARIPRAVLRIQNTIELRMVYFPRKTEQNNQFKIMINTGIQFRYNSTYVRQPVEFVRGAGALLWDDEGNEYLDLQSGYG